jgi:pilus assembly protein CpaE
VGKTTTSLNLGACLAGVSDESVVVVDLDLQFGDVGVAVGKPESEKSIFDLVSDPSSVTLESVRKSLEKVTDNFFVLLAPADPSQADRVGAALVEKIVEALQSGFDWVIIDSPPAFTDEILSAFDHADVQVLVSTPDLASVKNLSVATKTLERIGLDKTPRCVVLNRFDSKSGMDRSELVKAAESIAGTSHVFVVPDHGPILKSSTRGYVAALGPRPEKTRKIYKDLLAFVRSTRVTPGAD